MPAELLAYGRDVLAYLADNCLTYAGGSAIHHGYPQVVSCSNSF